MTQAAGRRDRVRWVRLAVASALIGLGATPAGAQTVIRHSNKPPPHKATPAAKPPPAPAPIPVPPVPPPPPSLPPPLVVPIRPPPPPLPATVKLDAPGEATPIKDGLRLTFAPDGAALNPTTDAAIRKVAHAPSVGAANFTITAFAKGLPDDPSAARRLSLSRALAVRSVLINEGVTSLHIYVKALGAERAPGVERAPGAPTPEEAPADRVDIVTSPNAPAAKSSQ